MNKLAESLYKGFGIENYISESIGGFEMAMESIVKHALSRTMGGEESIATRFRLEPTSGATFSNIDYYKLAEQEFGFAVKKASIVVVGCGGAGGNTVTRLTEMGVEGARTVSLKF